VLRGLNPAGADHLLIIPKVHIASRAGGAGSIAPLLGHIGCQGGRAARGAGLRWGGYRIVINTGVDGRPDGPTTLHLHLLGGRHMTWPPG